MLIEEGACKGTDEEVLRALAPLGVAVFINRKSRISNRELKKPWPDDIDDWTHFLHSASGNAVCKDEQIHNPKRIQWRCGPNHTRDHDALASISAMVSSRGKLFYILDEGPTSQIHQPPEWRLIARDAFNGILLWKRPIRDWVTHLYSFRVGPVWLGRKLVAVEDRVYSTLALNAPVSVLDADTGKTVMEYKGSEKTEEIVWHDGVLLLVTGDPGFMNSYAPKPNLYAEHKTDETPQIAKAVKAFDAKTGELLWERASENLKYLAPLSLSAIDKKAFFMDNRNIFCVDLKTGKDIWQAPFGTTGLFIRNYAPTLVVSKEVVVCVSDEKMAAYDVKEGKKLWGKDQGFYGFASPADLFIIGDLVWTGHTCKGDLKDILGIDLKTGEVKRSFSEKQMLPGGHHHRCYRNRATERYLIMGRRCVEFVDLQGDEHRHNWYIRGLCQYGIMPANGQLYVPPEPCRCFTPIKLNGLYSFVSTNHADRVAREGERLFKSEHHAEFVAAHAKRPSGPAAPSREKSVWPRAGIHFPSAEDWPTYRHDIARSGSVKANVPAELKQRWKRSLKGKTGSLVCAGGKVYVPSNDGCALACLSADTGEIAWEYLTGGGIDSPPTLHNGLAIFGCRDGTVHAVDAEKGDLIWRFRAAPVDSRIVADGRLESPWPVSGSVLVVGDTAYFAAGRSSFLDEGIFLYGVNATTGEKVCETVIRSESPKPQLGKDAPAKAKSVPPSGALPAVLISNGNVIVMQGRAFSPDLKDGGRAKVLSVPYGFMNDEWMHRTNWSLGGGGASYNKPFGKLLVFDGEVAYGAQNRYSWRKYSPWLWPQNHTGHHHQKYSRYKPDMFPTGVRLFAQKNAPVVVKEIETPDPERIPKGFARWGKPAMSSAVGHVWTNELPCQVRAMVATDRVLFVAGKKDSVAIYPELKTPDTGQPVLLALEKTTGKQLAEYKLPAAPSFDALIAARGELFISLQNGDVLCFEGKAP